MSEEAPSPPPSGVKRPRDEDQEPDDGDEDYTGWKQKMEEGKEEDDEEETFAVVTKEDKASVAEYERQRCAKLLDMLEKAQLERYEVYRRSTFKKSVMKRLVSSLAGGSIKEQTAISMSGITKIFVGELVEKARQIMVQWEHTGATRPEHVREAYRRLKLEGQVQNLRQNKKLFKR